MRQLYFTPDSENMGDDAVIVRLYSPPQYRTGGLHRHAEAVRQGGRGDDEVLLHITPDEFKQLKSAWGEPGINPNTGLPEYGFLKKIGNKLGKVAKKVIASPIVQKLGPIAASIFLPGVGGIIASAALKGVNAKLQGGKTSDVLKAGALGAVGAGAGKALLGGGNGALGKLAGNFMPGEARNAAQALQNRALTPEDYVSGGDSGGGGGGILGKMKNFFTNDQGKPAWGKIAGAGIGGLALLKGMQGSQKPTAPPPLPASFSSPLAQLSATRTQNPLAGRDLLHYGESPEGEFNFFQPTQYAPRAGGGNVRGPGSGRDDKIDALLSDGEYVMDAETVAMLGDGSLDEGARRLDQMRANLRKHKGAALARGKFSPNAKPPEQYLAKKKGGYVDTLEFWTKEKNRIGKQLKAGNYDGPAELASLKRNHSIISNKVSRKRGYAMGGPVLAPPPLESPYLGDPSTLHPAAVLRMLADRIGASFLQEGNGFDVRARAQQAPDWQRHIIPPGLAKGGKIDESTLRGIMGGRPKLTLEERAADLDRIHRMIQAYKQAQDAAAEEKKRLGITPEAGVDPYNNQPKPPLKLVEARGGLIEAKNRVSLIQNKVKRAEGGPVAALTSFADDLEEALNSGNKDRVAQLHDELGGYEKTIPQLYAKGGVIKPEQVSSILEKSRVPPASWNPDSLRAVAEELRKLNPNSEVLRQYDMAAKRPKVAAGGQ